MITKIAVERATSAAMHIYDPILPFPMRLREVSGIPFAYGQPLFHREKVIWD
jgi:hypothetical protein